MKLIDYLTAHGLSPEQFASQTGDASGSGVRKWLSGERTPRPGQMRRIAVVTHGNVLPNDFVLVGRSDAPFHAQEDGNEGVGDRSAVSHASDPAPDESCCLVNPASGSSQAATDGEGGR